MAQTESTDFLAGDTPPNITAIIPSKDRFTQVQSLVANLRCQDYPQDKLRILIIDDGSQPAYRFSDPLVRVRRHEQSQRLWLDWLQSLSHLDHLESAGASHPQGDSLP